MKILPKVAHGVRCGAIYRDPKGRELQVSLVIDDIKHALSLVLTARKGREWGSAYTSLDRFTSKGWTLLSPVADAAHVCSHCGGKEPRVFQKTGSKRFCRKATCWRVASDRAKSLAKADRVRSHAEELRRGPGALFSKGGAS